MNSPMPLRHVLMALAVVLIWGFNFVVIKVGVSSIPPLLMTTLRFAFTAALVVPFTRMTRQALPWIILLSFTLGTLHFTLLFVGMRGVDGGTGAILIQLGVPFSTILASVFLKDRLGIWRISGVTCAFLGAAILAGGPSIPSFAPFIILIVAAFGWAVSNLLIKKASGVTPLAMAGWVALFAVPQAGLASYLMEDGQIAAIQQIPLLAWAALGYVVVASSIVAYSLWYFLMSVHPVSAVVPFNLLSPLIGIVASALLLGDEITWQKIVGGIMTLSGVALIIFRQSMRSKSARAKPVEATPGSDH